MAAINIMLGLLENNIQVYAVVSKPPPDYQVFIDRLKESGAVIFVNTSKKIGLRYWTDLSNQAIEIMEKEKISIVHLHLPKLAYLLGKAVKKKNKKLVLTVEGDPLYEVKNLGLVSRLKMKLIWNACKKYPDIICPCSNWLSDIIQNRDKVGNVVTVHNPVDIKRFQSIKVPEKVAKSSEEDEFVIATAARLTKVKDVETLIKAYADFVNNVKTKSRLLILGEGELLERLQYLATELKVENQTKFLGFKDNPQDYIATADVFVMSSLYEPFGMPAAEAGAMGIPVIVSKVGGLAEIVEHEKTGYHFEIGDYKQLSKQLQHLYQNQELRNDMGNQAKERVSRLFAPEMIGKKFVEIYSKL